MKIEYKFGSSNLFIKQLINYNIDYYYFNSGETEYLKVGDVLYIFVSSGKINKGLYLFGMVKKDFNNWIDENDNYSFEKDYKNNYVAKLKVNEDELIKIDINHAYWRIAYLNGYISEKTYKHGLKLKDDDENMKKVYCMSLSTQGMSRKLRGYTGLNLNGKEIFINKPQLHKEIYDDIRNKTYKIMDELSNMIKKDFVKYNVDCITFKDESNIETVENYLKSKNLTYKIEKYGKDSKNN
jgi:hypothetical protein